MTWDDLAAHSLRVFSTPWCSDCHRLKRHLKSHDIAYTDVDIDADPEAAALLQDRTGRTAIPYVEIDGCPTLVRGWHREHPMNWDETVFLAELAGALEQIS